MSDDVLYERRGPVAWITINRPETRNVLSRSVREGLFAATRRFVDDDASVMVLTGAGDKAFCAGGDLKEMSGEALRVPPPDYVPQFERNIQVDKPIVAAVNGVAYAGGFLLAQNVDLIVAAEHARFAVTEVKVGRGAPWAAPLPWWMPPRVALELLLTGDPLTAQRAYELGFVNRVVPAADLVDATQELAERVAAGAPLSVRAAKATVYTMRERPLAQAYAEAERVFEPAYLSEDAQEGPRAFAERRSPVWKGR
ncbi:enoyl-CoA hydratase-related protein [Microbacterium sp. No. 7]|uniref:enoyl-CoA hydratase-related protein n=1 Tax=Microbacterium sp. No. 7 TaxID=1714373 RepID=UPI0006D0DC55|nr:enoyl-CoA hydratase-related protein [Microbacterium sp. No. 7]ALJ21693.1 enoyl-CoA hydratase [Microbacterium sp. No. 7]